MKSYKRILAAVDLAEGSAQVAHRARELATALGADLRLVHVVQPVLLTAMPAQQVLSGALVEGTDVFRNARGQLEGLGREIGVPDTHCEVVEGSLRDAIVDAAQDTSADLIVVGNHERHGLSLLLNKPTGDSVSRRAPCDVLEIRLAG